MVCKRQSATRFNYVDNDALLEGVEVLIESFSTYCAYVSGLLHAGNGFASVDHGLYTIHHVDLGGFLARFL